MAPSQRLTERINEALGVGPISPDALEFLVDGGVLVGAVGLEAESLCRAVPAIQRFGSALNTNVHFHTLVAQGVFVEKPSVPSRVGPLLRYAARGTAILTVLGSRFGLWSERR